MPDLELPTVRVPELQEHTNIPAAEDYMIFWSNQDNKTRKISVGTLKQVLQPSGGGSYTPVYHGGDIIYVVPEEKDGDWSFDIPQVAGMNFKVRRDMMPLIPEVEFLALSTGGVQVLDMPLATGQRFELVVFELSDGTIPGTGTGGGGGISGTKVINTNINVNVNDAGKIHQFRSGSNWYTATLPDIELVPANSVFIFEAIVGNTKQNKIITTNDQYIYHNNKSVKHIWLGKGEKIKLFRDEDGWYMIDGEEYFRNIGQPVAVFKEGLNQIAITGQLVNRSDMPRLFEEVVEFGGAYVDDATWGTVSATVAGRTVPFPYRGCYSSGNGSTTFRLPNFLNSTIRGLKNIGGSDAERYHNNPGGFQLNEVINHRHFTTVDTITNSNSFPDERGSALTALRSWIKGWIKGSGGAEGFVADSSPSEPTIGRTSAYGATETRMDNIGMILVVNY